MALAVAPSASAKVIVGTAGDDTLAGTDERDFVYGRAGNDVVVGNDARDFLFGQRGNDSLAGDAGADCLWGGAGYDALEGGGGPTSSTAARDWTCSKVGQETTCSDPVRTTLFPTWSIAGRDATERWFAWVTPRSTASAYGSCRLAAPASSSSAGRAATTR